MKKQSMLLIWIIAIAGFIVGSYGLWDRIANGHVNAAYGSYVPWGLWVAEYTYFIGLSAGAFLLSTLVFVFNIRQLEKVGKLALLTALVTLFAAMFLIFLDLGHPERAWKLIVNTNFRSIMGWMIWLYSSYFILLLAEFWFALRGDLVSWSKQSAIARFLTFGRRDSSDAALAADRRALRILGSIGVPLAIAFHGGVGALFGVLGSRPYWNSGLTPIVFLVGALLSGGALLTFVSGVFSPNRGTEEHRELMLFLGKIVIALLAFDVLLEWADYSISYYSSIPAHVNALKLVLFGPYLWVFWGMHLGLGIIIPAILLVVGRRSPRSIALAGLLIAVTFISVRLNIVIPALVTPEIQGLEQAFAGPGLTFAYFPSLTEWLLGLWAASLAVLVFLSGLRWLPILNQPKEVA